MKVTVDKTALHDQLTELDQKLAHEDLLPDGYIRQQVLGLTHQIADAPPAGNVAGLGSITSEGGSVLTLRFIDEAAADAFMDDYSPTVESDDMPQEDAPRAPLSLRQLQAGLLELARAIGPHSYNRVMHAMEAAK